MSKDRGAFESDTIHRLTCEVARYWVIECFLRTKELPEREVRFAYANGPHGFDWGNPPGMDVAKADAPLRGKRVVVTYEIKEESELSRDKDKVFDCSDYSNALQIISGALVELSPSLGDGRAERASQAILARLAHQELLVVNADRLKE